MRNATVADLNGDGKPEIIAANRYGKTPGFNHDGKLDVVAIDEATGIAIYVGRGDGTFAAPVPIGDKAIVPYALTVGDVDKDGRPDTAVARSEAPNVLYFASGPAGRCK